MTIQLRLLRRQNGLTLEALAGRTGLTASYLSKLERNQSTPSISTAIKLAEAFGVSVEELFGEVDDPALLTVVRAGDRTRLSDGGTPAGSPYEGIATGVIDKRMLPFVVYPPKSDAGRSALDHTGEEFIFVLEGRIELHFPDRTVELGAGDAVYFQGAIPHRARTLGSAQAAMLVVISADGEASSAVGKTGI